LNVSLENLVSDHEDTVFARISHSVSPQATSLALVALILSELV